MSTKPAGEERRLRLLVYTDNRDFGGADLSLSHLVAALDARVDVAVLGVSRKIVDWIARRPVTIGAAFVRTFVPFARSGRTSFTRTYRARGRVSMRSPRQH
jgi:hypothetical protein